MTAPIEYVETLARGLDADDYEKAAWLGTGSRGTSPVRSPVLQSR